MNKHIFKILISILLVLSLLACGKTDNNELDKKDPESEKPVVVVEDEAEEKEDEVEELDLGVLIVGETIKKGDKGSGPVVIESRMGKISIPEGLDYELYGEPLATGNTASIRIDFGPGNTGAGYIELSTTRMIKSLDDAVEECIRTSDFGTMESEIGDEIIYGDKTFKEVTIKKADDSDIRYYLVSYYPAEDDWDGYIEVYAGGEGHYYNMDIKDPLITEILNTLVVNKK